MAMRQPFRIQHRRRIGVALIVAIALVAGGGLGLAWAGHHASRPARRPGGRIAPVGGNPGIPSAGAARLRPATPVTAPPADLAGLGWASFYGVDLPVSHAAGPWHVSHGLAWGFADTPLGALLAAVNIGVRANAQWGPGIFAPTIRNQMTGPGAPALLAACRASYQQASQAMSVPAGQPLGRAYVSEEAFRWVIYTPADATVDIVSAGPGIGGTTARAVTQIEVVWVGGDWRVIAPPGGDWGNSAAPLASLNGYTSFPIPSA
jgi:hypothetical protein